MEPLEEAIAIANKGLNGSARQVRRKTSTVLVDHETLGAMDLRRG